MKKYLILIAIVSCLVIAGVAYGNITDRKGVSGQNELQTFTFFSATTTSATSTDVIAPNAGYARIVGAKKATLYLSRGGATSANTGTSTFYVQVTPDGTNWYDYNKMVSTSSESTITPYVRIEAATSTTIVGLNLDYYSFYGLRCIVVETTDGEHTCKASIEF
jgi:hypothetical protein